MSKKLILVAIILGAILAFFYFDLQSVFNLQYLQEQKAQWLDLYQQHPFLFMAGFFALYVLFTSLALPAASILTVAAGAIFGFVTGLILVSFASTTGAVIAFLITRYLVGDTVKNKFSKQLVKINQGMEEDGALYAFSMRLVPLFPFFLVNSLLALTSIKVRTYYWTSQLGMLAGTAVYVNAGTQLSTINSLGDIVSPNILISFVLLGIFPFIAKYLLKFIRSINTGNTQ